jgi:hypothetical protein
MENINFKSIKKHRKSIKFVDFLVDLKIDIEH